MRLPGALLCSSYLVLTARQFRRRTASGARGLLCGPIPGGQPGRDPGRVRPPPRLRANPCVLVVLPPVAPRALRAAFATATPADDFPRATPVPPPPPGAMADPQRVELVQEIVLTEEERALFKTLVDAAAHFGTGTTLRVVGGWVRDKLLGRDSPDIDVTTDNMLGKDFAVKVNEFLVLQGVPTGSVGVIAVNPEQSKHLETARMRVRGVWVDLVNLRSETYAADSRIPAMAFGSPSQDARRRDLTINALFYNLNDRVVEDLTGRGLADLRAGRIVTPLPPRETFLDDPLRVLRAVRFAARFGFALDPGLESAAAADDVRVALSTKVSRERVGTELDGMLSGPAPLDAIRALARLRLLELVLQLPPVFEPLASPDTTGPSPQKAASRAYITPLPQPTGGAFAAASLAATEAGQAVADRRPGGPLCPEDRRALLLGSMLLPLRGAAARDPRQAAKRPVAASAWVTRESLRLKTADGSTAASLHAAAPSARALQHALAAAPGGHGAYDSPGQCRVAAGTFVRRAGAQWRAALALGAVLDCPAASVLVPAPDDAGGDGGNGGGGEPQTQAQTQSPQWLDGASGRCWAAEAAIVALGLESAYELKPLLDGKAVMAAVGATAAGPRVGPLVAAVVDWQLGHPGGTAEECAAWLREREAAREAEAEAGAP